MTLDLSPRRAAIRARLKCALARVGSCFGAREDASAAPSRSPAWNRSYPRLCHACGLSGCASHSSRSMRAASRQSPSAPRHAAASAHTSPLTSPLRCSSGRRSARASFPRPCLKSSWARCTPEDDDGGGAGAADPFFATESPPRKRQDGVPLLPEAGRHSRIDVGEDRLDARRRDSFRLLDCAGDLVADLLFEPLLSRVVPPAGVLEVLPEPRERVAGLPRGDLRLIAVPRGIVARGMGPDAVRDRLDQRRPESLPGTSRRISRRPAYGKGLHPIHAA